MVIWFRELIQLVRHWVGETGDSYSDCLQPCVGTLVMEVCTLRAEVVIFSTLLEMSDPGPFFVFPQTHKVVRWFRLSIGFSTKCMLLNVVLPCAQGMLKSHLVNTDSGPVSACIEHSVLHNNFSPILQNDCNTGTSFLTIMVEVLVQGCGRAFLLLMSCSQHQRTN